MSKRWRNRIQKRARVKSDPMAERAIGYLPLGPLNPSPPPKRNRKHYERRRRVQQSDERNAA